MTDIKSVHAREIIDSRGNPTLEAEVSLVFGAIAGVQRFHPALPPVPARRSSCATAMPAAMAARVCSNAVANVNGEISGRTSPAWMRDATRRRWTRP